MHGGAAKRASVRSFVDSAVAAVGLVGSMS